MELPNEILRRVLGAEYRITPTGAVESRYPRPLQHHDIDHDSINLLCIHAMNAATIIPSSHVFTGGQTNTIPPALPHLIFRCTYAEYSTAITTAVRGGISHMSHSNTGFHFHLSSSFHFVSVFRMTITLQFATVCTFSLLSYA